MTVKVNVCDTCYNAFNQGKIRSAFKAQVENSEKLPIVLYQKLLAQAAQAITEDVPKLKELLEIIGSEHTEENANDLKVHTSLNLSSLHLIYSWQNRCAQN